MLPRTVGQAGFSPAGILVWLLAPLLFAGTIEAGDNFLDPVTGYRISHYQGVVPDNVPGGIRITTEEAEQIFKNRNAEFIDVSPSVGGGFDPETGQWRLTKTHDHIPGSTWLPDVGRGNPGPVLLRYFKDNLATITAGDKARAILIYCKADCWMGWNAAKRASGFGYTKIYWYPDGIDGWSDWDNPSTPAEPVPVKIENGKPS